MQNPAYNLSMVFEQTSDWNFAEVILTARMIRTLALVNGETSVAELCEAMDETYADLFSDLQKLHELRLIKLAPPPAVEKVKNAPRVKRGYYRGAGFEMTVDENGSIPARPPATRQAKKAPRVKRGYYRGAGFEVTVDEKSNVVPSHNI